MTDNSTTTTAAPAQGGGKKLGRLPAKSSEKALLFKKYLRAVKVPAESDFWRKRSDFPGRTYGNAGPDGAGDCTRASQANASVRMERIETRRTIDVADAEVLRVYFDMTTRLYGGGDTGAYETDALDEWRRPDRTFKDMKGRAYVIDAYTRVNHLDLDEVRAAIYLSGTKGIKLCLSLPQAFLGIDPPAPWDIPDGQVLTGNWLGQFGHSLFADAYGKEGVRLVHSWYTGEGVEYHQTLTWRAFAAYVDEVHSVVDSIDAWRKHAGSKFATAKLVSDVAKVSSYPIQPDPAKRGPHQRGR
jgi:hypothetical protein